MNFVEPILSSTVSPVSVGDWDRIYSRDSFSLPTQAAVWANSVIRSAGSVGCSRLYKFSDGIKAVLQLFFSKFSLQSLRVMRLPPPAWGFGGAISTKPLRASYVSVILGDFANLRIAHVVDRKGGFEEGWTSRFPGKTRNKIREAKKVGVAVETCNSDTLITEFEGLFQCSIARWALIQNEFGWLAAPHGHLRDLKQKFATMAQLSREVLTVSIARLNHVPVAGINVLFEQNAHYAWGAMDERIVGNITANCLLQEAAVKEACLRKCKHNHMGETGSSTLLAEFKPSIGAVAVPHAEYRYERIPLMSADQKLRSIVKGIIGFQDA